VSADLLRRAAAKLREQAESATAGPWAADEDGEVFQANGEEEPWVGNGAIKTAGNAPYFALMHPPVALAVADVLLHAAQRFEQAHGECLADGWDHAGHPSCPNRPKDIDRAIALAREILRESS
jgi:hypothetical protein